MRRGNGVLHGRFEPAQEQGDRVGRRRVRVEFRHPVREHPLGTEQFAQAWWLSRHPVASLRASTTQLCHACVDPARQGQGVGRALGEYVLDWCRQMGFASIQFNAVVESNDPAVHLWQSLGFQIVGTVPESFDHPEHGLVGLHIMFRHL